MPAALSTTKRKFSQLLESISSPSSASIPSSAHRHVPSATSPKIADSPAKRPRTSQQSHLHAVNAMATSTSLRSTLKTPLVSKVTVTATSNSLSNFAPWDRGQFLGRLETFRHVDRWTGKPDSVNEVQWAKRGWSCVGRERVRCKGGCEREVVVMLEEFSPSNTSEPDHAEGKLPDGDSDEEDWREKAYEELVEKYTGMIVSEHEASCLWRRKGCDDTVYRLPLANQATAISHLRDRYVSLASTKSDLPSELTYPSHVKLDIFTKQAQTLLSKPPLAMQPQVSPNANNEASSAAQNVPELADISPSALILALFGWQADAEHISGLVTCKACFRRLGLWLFCAPAAEPSTVPSQAAMMRLDVVGEHRDYCPWINALSQSELPPATQGGIQRPGWEILHQAVENSSRPRISDSFRVPITGRDDRAVDRPISGESSLTMADSIDVDSSSVALSLTAADLVSRDEKDRERWARLKKLKQAFHVKKDTRKNPAKSKSLSQLLTGGKA